MHNKNAFWNELKAKVIDTILETQNVHCDYKSLYIFAAYIFLSANKSLPEWFIFYFMLFYFILFLLPVAKDLLYGLKFVSR